MSIRIESDILRQLKTPELTTGMLLGMLSRYKNPRKKIHNLVEKGILISVKQGVYLVDVDIGLRPYSREIFANLIYGPSYISLETALSSYGFIPESVETTTSICLGKKKNFLTPIGQFDFFHVNEIIYPIGVTLKEVYENRFCQFALPEKALLDLIQIREKKMEFASAKIFFEYFVESYRLDVATILKTISYPKLTKLAKNFSHKNINWFVTELGKVK